MIVLPRRSVTRFFIPLIDVLTVLFCIFLLMPLIQAPEASAESSSGLSTPDLVRGDTAAANAAPAGESIILRQQRAELEAMERATFDTLQQRLFVRVLEIDAETGKLYTQEGGNRVEIANQAGALELIARHRQEAEGKELFYLFLFPRRLTGFPEERQIKRYETWFKGVAHGRDNPLSDG